MDKKSKTVYGSDLGRGYTCFYDQCNGIGIICGAGNRCRRLYVYK